MDSPSRTGAVLLPKSPEKINRLPQSPIRANMDPFVASPGGNSVQGKVAQFNNLSKDALQKRKDNEAALKRAVLGREEAESETRRLKEENAMLRQKLEDARARDQKVAKKFEAFSEEKFKLLEHQHKVQKISNEEVRRARKEAFKFSSALVGAQEDLQKAREHLEEMNDQANIERNRGKKFQQEAFDAKMALSDVEEELEEIRKKLQVIQQERDVLRKNLNEEQLARVAAEGRIALPTPEQDDEFASPRKSKARRVSRRVSSRRESLKENMDPAWRTSNDIFDIMWAAEEGDEFAIAKRNLWVEEKRRQEAEMMVKYLKAQYDNRPSRCVCSEQPAETATTVPQRAEIIQLVTSPMVSVPSLALEIEDLQTPIEDTILRHEVHRTEDDDMISLSAQSELPPFAIHEDGDEDDVTPVQFEAVAPKLLAPVVPSTSPSLLNLSEDAEKENAFRAPRLGVFEARLSQLEGMNTADTSILSIKSEDVDDSERSNLYPLAPRAVPNQLVGAIQEMYADKSEMEDAPIRIATPLSEPNMASLAKITPIYRSSTTTVSIPLKGVSPEKSSAKNYPFSPGATMTREQALEAIKQRRRRARSIHDNPLNKKPSLGELLRRDVSSKSAPA